MFAIVPPPTLNEMVVIPKDLIAFVKKLNVSTEQAQTNPGTVNRDYKEAQEKLADNSLSRPDHPWEDIENEHYSNELTTAVKL